MREELDFLGPPENILKSCLCTDSLIISVEILYSHVILYTFRNLNFRGDVKISGSLKAVVLSTNLSWGKNMKMLNFKRHPEIRSCFSLGPRISTYNLSYQPCSTSVTPNRCHIAFFRRKY